MPNGCFDEIVQLYIDYQENVIIENLIGRYYSEALANGHIQNEPLWQQLIVNTHSFWYLTLETPCLFIDW